VRDTPTPTERREAFRAIYAAHHAALCAYFARRTPRDEVEDLAAETFAVAWCKLPRKAGGPGGGSPPRVAGARSGDRRSRRARRRAPLRHTDHSWGLDASGKPLDQTYVETVQDFEILPDSPENRKLLDLGVR
jgi:RNA polymerase sigma-70 factor (ECF subfamily)